MFVKSRTIRYFSRMFKVSAKGFAKDEQGSVMALTVVFALPMAMFVLACYNIGMGLTTRMRAQNVADAASYTSSLWQARFLNYCAYTRRQITANYAVIGMCTAYDSMLPMFINIFNSSNLDCLLIPCSDDSGIVHDGMELTYNLVITLLHLNSGDSYNDSDSTNVVRIVRKGADAMNKMLSESQFIFYTSVGLSTIPIMKQVVKDADRQISVGGTGDEFELDTTPLAALALAGTMGSLRNLVEQKAITKDEVWYYTDYWTRGDDFFGMGSLNVGMFGRGPVGMVGFDPRYCSGSEYIQAVATFSDGLNLADDGSTFKTKETVIGTYVWFWICIDDIGGPIFSVIYGPDTESNYDTAYPFDSAKVYQISDGVSGGDLEPSTLAIVKAKTDKMAFFQQTKGLGKLLGPANLLPSGKQIQAFSRAKVYFAGPGEDIPGNKYMKPHTSYARWGAKLAGLSDGPTVSMAPFLAPALAKGRTVQY